MFDAEEEAPRDDAPFTARALAASLVLHIAILGVAAAFKMSAPTPPPKEEAVAIDMTVVVDENLDKPPDDLPPVKTPVEPPPLPPKPPEPPKPPVVEPPPALPAVEIVKPEPPKPKPETKKPEPPKPPEKPKFVKGKRTKRAAQPPPERRRVVRQPPPDVRAALGGNGPRTDRRMPDVDKWLKAGARPGTRNVVSDNEGARCRGLIKRQFYEVWQPPAQDSRLQQPQVEFKMDPLGRISAPRIVRTSGSREVDDSAISALRQLGRFTGLSREFIESCGGTFTLELEIQ